MSLEAALEEERLGVMKILEEQERKKKEKRANTQHKRSTSDGNHQTQRRPVSLLLNEEPLDLDDHLGEKQRSNSAVAQSSLILSPPTSPRTSKKLSPRDDPTDPLVSPDTYYYTAEQLRPRLRSPSPRKSGGGRSSSSYAVMDRKKASHTNTSSNAAVVTDEELSKQFRHAYRRLSATHLSKADGALGELYKEKRLQKDYDDESGSSDDAYDDDDGDDDDDDNDGGEPATTKSHDRFVSARSSLIIDDANALLKNNNVPKSESPQNVQRLKYKSMLEVDPAAKAAAEYAAHKRRIIHPNTAFDDDDGNGADKNVSYTSDNEELRDAKKAAGMELQVSPIHSNLTTKRAVRSMRRGDLPALSDPATPKQKSYVISTDLSPEASHALEWTIGTVIRDGNVMYVVCAFEDDPQAVAGEQEEERLQALDQMTKQVSKLLRKTRLQVHVILEAIHCKTPKHMLVEIIDHVSPTLVILGSRGRSALKGVLLGSFSNYIVERSSVPVMVARRKLQKSKHKDLNVRLANNLHPRGFAQVKID